MDEQELRVILSVEELAERAITVGTGYYRSFRERFQHSP